MNMKLIKILAPCIGVALITGLVVGCSQSGATTSRSAPVGITPQQMADALFTVMASDRAVYTKKVVQRLQNEEKVIRASEHWQDDKARGPGRLEKPHPSPEATRKQTCSKA